MMPEKRLGQIGNQLPERRTQLDEVSLGAYQTNAAPTAREREIARDRVNPAELLLLRTPQDD